MSSSAKAGVTTIFERPKQQLSDVGPAIFSNTGWSKTSRWHPVLKNHRCGNWSSDRFIGVRQTQIACIGRLVLYERKLPGSASGQPGQCRCCAACDYAFALKLRLPRFRILQRFDHPWLHA
jgi:hypothetical protein